MGGVLNCKSQVFSRSLGVLITDLDLISVGGSTQIDSVLNPSVSLLGSSGSSGHFKISMKSSTDLYLNSFSITCIKDVSLLHAICCACSDLW